MLIVDKTKGSTVTDQKLPSIVDEYKRNYKRSKVLFFNFNPSTLFKAIVKLSMQDFKGVNWKNYLNFKVGDRFKPLQTFTIFDLTDYKIDEVYEIHCKTPDVQYWLNYRVSPVNENKTKLIFTQNIYYKQAIVGFRGLIAKWNFNKAFEKRISPLQKALYESAKRIQNDEN